MSSAAPHSLDFVMNPESVSRSGIGSIDPEAVHAALLTLPDAEQVSDPFVSTEVIDSDGFRARIFFKRARTVHGDDVRWWWSALRAEALE